MIGQEFASEKRLYQDPKTGREVWQLTGNNSENYHIYFTDNSFSLGDKEIYYLSDRGSTQPELFNVFKMDLTTGISTQLTDEPGGIQGHTTKTPDSEIIVFETPNQVKKLDTRTGKSEVLFEESGRFRLGAPFISPDKKYLGMIRNEWVNIERGPNYSGFKDSMFAIKRAVITLIYLDGSKALDVYEDTHYLGHFQFAPDDSTLAMFCHEGPWNLVQQRIWLLDFVTRSAKPCFRQKEDDCVGHEFWTRDGRIFFDNRRAGHDGTITSSKTQATVQAPDETQIPYVGIADKNGEVVDTIDMPYYCNHYHANNDNSLLVGDEVEDLVLIDIRSKQPAIKKLCTHNTSWYTNRTHAHPTFSWSGQKVLFTSDREGKKNLYLTEIGDHEF